MGRRYYFDLARDQILINDLEGEELPDERAARDHANTVAHELMRNQEARARHWRIHVHDGTYTSCFDLQFADVDDS